MTDPDYCREKLMQWRERAKERGIRLQDLRNSLALMRAENSAVLGVKPRPSSPSKAKTETSPTTSGSALSSQSSTSDDKENVVVLHGSTDIPSKKRRLMPLLAPTRLDKGNGLVKENVCLPSPASSSQCDTNNGGSMTNIAHVVSEDLSKRVLALEAKLQDAMSQNTIHMTRAAQLEAHNSDLQASNAALEVANALLKGRMADVEDQRARVQAELESRTATSMAQIASITATFEASLTQLSTYNAARDNELSETIHAKYEARLSDLSTKLLSTKSKYDAIRDDVDLACNDRAGTDIMPQVEALEDQLYHDDDDNMLEEARSLTLPALKKRLREYAVWVKLHDEDRQLLQFSNQVYLQQINELQQKHIALHKEVSAARQKVADIEAKAATDRQELDECEEANNTLLSKLEKSMEKTKQLQKQLAAAVAAAPTNEDR
ncbi:hypothetical protein, variant 1 [Aphanomyces astaci]|uniref:Uncharacterized protein n=2 Tax=Aphanomyces astaci TaxID=112090 RepID=W4H8X7_APHAT|nr:hypothetical protein, variant 1 [Aphanomyces astaci]ETV88500.1 hypothetical protein, variant 1 [Aphanomyces astaci]|eukprot:XP_009820900.1 hypothetical protein, variant 1 [Aphanomyces astaci]